MFLNIINKHFNKIILTAAFTLGMCVQALCSPGVINDNAVNIRAASSTDSDIVAVYNKGKNVKVTSFQGDWAQIEFNGGSAYVYRDYVTVTPDKYYVTVNCDGLNFRKEASSSSSIIKLLPQGYNLTLTKNCGDWMQVKDTKGNVGYVSTEFITINKGETPQNANESQVVETAYSSKGAEVAAYAQKYVGLKYVYGGTSLTSGTDCSGFTSAIYKNFGISLNRTSRNQMSNGVAVTRANIQPGDLVLFDDGYQVDHVGMYIGNNKYIHNSMNAGKVIISDFSGPYVNNHLAGIRRVI